MFYMHSKKIFLILIIALLFLAGCTQQLQEKFSFTWKDNGVTYKSNQPNARAIVSSFSIKPALVIETELHSEQNPENAEIFNWSAIPLYTIISGNDRNAIQFIKLVKDNKLEECITNFGDFNSQVKLNSSDCNALMQEWKSLAVISLPLPNQAIAEPFIEVKQNSLILHSRSTQEESVLTMALAEKLFPNAKSVLEKASKKLKELK